VEWEVEYTDQFEEWWNGLDSAEQEDVAAKVGLLKELIVQHAGRPDRILFAFDPRRCAILLIGGDKTGRDRWYEEYVPRADRLYDQHLEMLRRENRARRWKER
jgi:hypothetical protein